MVVCDTHIIVWDAMNPSRLSTKVRSLIDTASATETLACADISLWEMAMLAKKGRIEVNAAIGDFIIGVIEARGYRVLPVTPEIAVLSQDKAFSQGNPADRLIAATAWHHHATLVTHDAKLQAIPGLKTFF